MTQLKRCHQRKPGIFELMPRVDVSLMLVVFLLLSSGMVASEDQHVPIDLPVTGSGEAGEAVSMSYQSVLAGDLLGTRSLALDQLEVVVIRADRKSEHGRVMEVIDELWRFKVGTIFYASDKGRGMVMRVDVVTLFADACDAWCETSIVGRARRRKLLDLTCHDPRRLPAAGTVVDDRPLVVGQVWCWRHRPLRIVWTTAAATRRPRAF